MAKTYNLKRIRLINFHNFADETVDVNGHLFLIGGNGSGKTTVLDAVHFVLTAGRRMELNAAARMAKAIPGHGRKIQGIFLRYDVEKGQRNPDNTIGYAALEFENPDNSHKFCIGCGALAITMDSHPVIWGFESSGSLEELQLVRKIEDEIFPFNQEELKATGTCRVFARDRYIQEVADKFFNGAANYRETMNLIASGKSYRELVSRFHDQSQLFRALLPPPEETDYEKIRDSLKDIEQIQLQVDRQQARIDALRDLEKRQDEAISQRERVARMKCIVADAEKNQTQNWLKNLEDEERRCSEELKLCLDALKKNEIEKKELAAEIAVLENSDAYRNSLLLQNLQSRLADLQKSSAELVSRVENLNDGLLRLRQSKEKIFEKIGDWWQQLQHCCERLNDIGRFDLVFERAAFENALSEKYQLWLERARAFKVGLSDEKAVCRQEIARVEKHAAELEIMIARLEKQPEPVPPAPLFEELQRQLHAEKIEFLPFYRMLEPAPGLSDSLARVIEELIGPENLCAVFASGSQQNRARAAVIARPFNIPVIDVTSGPVTVPAVPVGGLRHYLQFNLPEQPAAERFAAELLDKYEFFSSDDKLLKQAKRFAVSVDGLILQDSALRRVSCDQNRYIGSRARARTRQEEIDRLRYEVNSESMNLEKLKNDLNASIERQKIAELAFDDLNRLRPGSLEKLNDDYIAAGEQEKHGCAEMTRTQLSQAELEAEIAGCTRQISVCSQAVSDHEPQKIHARLQELVEAREKCEKSLQEELRRHGRLEQRTADLAKNIDQAGQQLVARNKSLKATLEEMMRLKPGLDEIQLRDYIYVTKGGQQIRPENCDANLRQAEISFARHHTDLKNCINNNTLLQKDFNFALDDETLEVRSNGKSLKELALVHEKDHEKNRGILNSKNRDLFENLIINNIVRRLWQEEERLKKTIDSMNCHLGELKFGNTVYRFKRLLRSEFKEFRDLVHGASIADETSRGKLRDFFEVHKQAMIREGSELPDFLDYRKWHDVVLKAKTASQGEPGGDGVELSPRTLSLGSGGEQSVPNYLLLLSLAKVHLDHTHSKIRILLIDEAFYGIDAQRRDELLSFADSIGLNLVIAHPDLDGVTEKMAKTTTLIVEKTPAGDVYLGEYVYSRSSRQPAGLFDEPSLETVAEIRIN